MNEVKGNKQRAPILFIAPAGSRHDIVTQRELQRLRKMFEVARLVAERAAAEADGILLRIHHGAEVQPGRIGAQSLRGNLVLAKVVGRGLRE